jgi:hypothetical protein
MKKLILLAFFATIQLFQPLFAQNEKKVAVFYDCQSTWKCSQYYDFVRAEIKMVDFVNDRFASDVQLQVTEQQTGSNGSKFIFSFIGRNRFDKKNDTLTVIAQGVATDDEIRKDFVKAINKGLVKYVLDSDVAKFLNFTYETPKEGTKKNDESAEDPWNLWVYSIGVRGNANGDANYSDKSFYGNISANRVTENNKISFWGGLNRNVSTFTYNDEKIKVDNYGADFSLEVTRAINQKWSYGVDFEGEQSSFRNFKLRASLMPKIEYSFFPYKDFNAKRVVAGYMIGLQKNIYFDTTLYLKTNELRGRQTFFVNTAFTQKWGNINFGMDWSNYLHDINLNKFGLGGAVEWRIVKGLRLSVYGNYEFIRNQINLAKGNATKDELLTRQRQIGSSFNYWGGVGVRYQFGSNKNNAVNARFNGTNYSISF